MGWSKWKSFRFLNSIIWGLISLYFVVLKKNVLPELWKLMLNFSTFSVGGWWGQPMLIFLKFVDETKMPKPQEYQKVVFSWPQRSSKYIKSSRKTLYAGAVATSSSSKDSFVIIIIRLVSSSYFSRKICLSLSTIASLALSSNNIKNIVMTNLDVNRLRRCCSNQLQS